MRSSLKSQVVRLISGKRLAPADLKKIEVLMPVDAKGELH